MQEHLKKEQMKKTGKITELVKWNQQPLCPEAPLPNSSGVPKPLAERMCDNYSTAVQQIKCPKDTILESKISPCTSKISTVVLNLFL